MSLADTMHTVTDWLRTSAGGRAIVDQAVAAQDHKRLEDRAAWAAELATLDAAELVEVRDTYEPARAAALADVKRHDAALADARERLVMIEQARRIAAGDAAIRGERLRGALRASASPLLPAFLSEMRALARATFAQTDTVLEKRLDGSAPVAWSNHGSVTARLDAIRSAIAACDETGTLLYAAIDESSLTAALDRLRATIPDLEPRPRQFRGVSAA